MSLEQCLFAPRSVALIGASDDRDRVSGRPAAFLQQHGFKGALWPVNPRRETVQGLRSYTHVDDLPDVPDHAYILMDSDAALKAALACVARGVPVISILADGFDASREEAQARTSLLHAAITDSKTRLVGPQSLGVIDTANGLSLTANAAFAEPALLTGGTMLLSHSGSMLGALLSRAASQGIGWRRLVSVGSELDLSMGEIGQACVANPDIDGFALFLETIRDRDAFAGFCAAAHAAGKPVVALRLGRTPIGQLLAQSHTGAILGDGAALDAFLQDCGVCVVETLDGLIHASPLARCLPTRRPRNGVAVVATTGGGGAMAVEALCRRGVAMYTPYKNNAGSTSNSALPAMNGPLLDVTLAGTRPEVMSAALDQVMGAGAGGAPPDLVVAVVGSSARFHPQLAAKPLISHNSDVPLAVLLMPDAPETGAMLRREGLPVLPSPESLADALAGCVARRFRSPVVAVPASSTTVRLMDEKAAFDLFERRGVAVAGYCIQPVSSTALPPDLTYPVAVKGLVSGVAHKSDAGLVHLDVSGPDELARISTELGVLGCDTVLIMAMERGLAEVIVGYRNDPVVGPVVMVAPGGALAEIHDDCAVRTAPVDRAAALAMIEQVQGLAPIRGYRNLPRGDIDALASTIVAVSGLGGHRGPAIIEAEINPLLVRAAGQGVVAVDALAVVSEDE